MINEPFENIGNGLNNPELTDQLKSSNDQIYSIIRATIDE